MRSDQAPVIIRPGRDDDVPALTEIYNHYVINTHYTFDIDAWTVDKRRARWFAQFATSGRYRLFVAETKDDKRAVIGYASSTQFKVKRAYETSVESTIYLHPDWPGRGVGTMLYTALFDALRGEDVHRAYAGVALPNDGSLTFHQRMKFVPIGTYHEVGRKFGRFWDVAWLERPVG